MSGYIIKPWEELTITDDYMFKLVMRHKRFCKRLIEKIPNIRIKDIHYLEEEKSFKFKYDSKGILVLCQDLVQHKMRNFNYFQLTNSDSLATLAL